MTNYNPWNNDIQNINRTFENFLDKLPPAVQNTFIRKPRFESKLLNTNVHYQHLSVLCKYLYSEGDHVLVHPEVEMWLDKRSGFIVDYHICYLPYQGKEDDFFGL